MVAFDGHRATFPAFTRAPRQLCTRRWVGTQNGGSLNAASELIAVATGTARATSATVVMADPCHFGTVPVVIWAGVGVGSARKGCPTRQRRSTPKNRGLAELSTQKGE